MKDNEKLKELVKDTIKCIVKQLAQIDRLIEDIEDYDKLNKIDDLLYFNINETIDEIDNIICGE